MIYEIKNKEITLKVNSLGAQMMSIIFNGKERLWQNENNTWPKHAPILFPHASKCSVIVNGKRYIDSSHGFARDLEWEVLDKKDDSITLILKQSDYTKEQYPFDFNFITKYTLIDNGVEISQTVKNTDCKDLYYSIGAHETYALDRHISGYYIEFEKEETSKEFGFINTKKVDLCSSLLDKTSIVFDDIKSRKVYLKEKITNKVIAETDFKEYPVLVLWHSPNSKMICIEPWLNIVDTKETENLEFKDKKHILTLKPNSEKTLIRNIRYF